MRKFSVWILSFCLLLFCGCETNRVVVNDVDEREANEIIVFLASRNIKAEKVASKNSSGLGGESGPSLWGIAVEDSQMTEAMALLNQNGLPRKKGTNLLELFAKQGLMSSEKEEMIRYQAGLEQQIANTIRKIDGVIDADVQLSFPSQETSANPTIQGAPQRVTAAVYVKHQGIIDDPNSHLVSKIKRLVAGSVNGLDIGDVTVISDRSRFTDLSVPSLENKVTNANDYVSIWSIVMSEESALRFQVLFFGLVFINIGLVMTVGWILWKFSPILKENGGFKQLFNPVPLKNSSNPENEAPQ